MDWPTIHHYAEEVELWSSLAINIWVLASAAAYVIRRRGLVEGAGYATFWDSVLIGGYFVLFLVPIAFGVFFWSVGEWQWALGILVLELGLVGFSFSGGPLLEIKKKK